MGERVRKEGLTTEDDDTDVSFGERDNLIHFPPPVQVKQRQWQALCSHLNTWFYKPDLDALKLCLAAYAAHTYLDEEPVWFFIIGPSGSGKTSIAIKSLEFLPNTHLIGALTTKSFASGMRGKGILNMLHEKHNGNGVLLFPDFTTILSTDPKNLQEIAGQMRQIFDGKFAAWTGSNDDAHPWKGKVTCIAAATEALENHWQLMRNLGERFLYLRWRCDEPYETAKAATRLIGHKIEVETEFNRLVKQYVSMPFRGSSPDKEISEGLTKLAYLVSIMRTVVRRENYGRKIASVDTPEIPTRIQKALEMITLGCATLDNKPNPDTSDAEICRRLAYDSMPNNRLKILEALLSTDSYDISQDGLKTKTGIQGGVFQRTLEDMEVLNIIKIDEGIEHVWVSLTPRIVELWKDSYVIQIDN
jgi:hypothetical protein